MWQTCPTDTGGAGFRPLALPPNAPGRLLRSALAAFFIFPLLGSAATLTLSTSGTPVRLGSAVTLTAAVTPAPSSGSVTFYDGVSILGIRALSGGQAVLTTSLLPAGSRSLTARYAGLTASLSQVIQAQPATGFQGLVTYATPAVFPPGPVSAQIAVGDFNGDGKPDLIVPAGTAVNAQILLNSGNGAFGRLNIPYNLANAVVGDFNGDGIDDIFGSGMTLLGNGDGTFRAVSSSNTDNLNAVAVGDFNNDGKADLLAANAGSIVLLLGNGDGSFQAPVTLGPLGGAVAIGDFNGDGNADVVMRNTVLLGNGDGTFQSPISFSSGPLPASIAIGDFNGDGKPDMAVGGVGITIYLGNGDGTFRSLPVASNLPSPIYLSAGDMDGDGNADLVALTNSSVSVLAGNGDGTFQAAAISQMVSVGGGFGMPVLGDFNGDGRADLAFGGPSVGVLLGASLLPTTVTVTSAANPSSYGQVVRLTVTVSPAAATGFVTIFNGGQLIQTAPLLNGQSLYGSGTLEAGSYTFTATYRGDATYAGSASPPLVQVVQPAPSATTLSSSPNPAAAGSTVILGATVSPGGGGGTVSFFNGTSLLGTRPLGSTNSAVLTTSFANAGSYALTVAYSGSNDYLPSTSPVITQTISGQTSPTTVTLTSSTISASYGRPVMLTATVSAVGATGKATFYDGTSVLGVAAVTSGRAVLTTSALQAGVHVLKTHYSGDLSYGPSTSTTVAASVSAAPGNGFLTAAYAAGGTPQSIVAADFNGDGYPDLAIGVAGVSNGLVSVLLNRGDGTFAPALSTIAGYYPVSLATGDFNLDGNADIAVANQNGTIAILLGNGDGTFQPPRQIPGNTSYAAIAVADFDGDGIPDLAVANQSARNASVYLGFGDGTFQPPVSVALDGFPNAMVVGDFNGDGFADLAIAVNSLNSTGIAIDIVLGGGDGTLRSGKPIVGPLSNWLATGDFNGDGIADLVVTFAGAFSVMAGRGDGTFAPAMIYAAGKNAGYAVSGDFNGDGKTDLMIANLSTGSVMLFTGNGDGTFPPGVNYPAGNNPRPMAVADLNGDGITDLVVGDLDSSSITVLRGRLAGASETMLTSSTNPAAYGSAITLTASVATNNSAAQATGRVAFYDAGKLLGTGLLANGRTSLSISSLASGLHALSAAYVGDPQNGGSVSSKVQQLVGAAPVAGNGFHAAGSYSANVEPIAMVTGDFNGDGKPDLATANFGSVADGGSVSVFLGNGDGTFQKAVSYAAGSGTIAIAAADCNGDGKIDLVVANNTDNTISVLLGNGDGTFQQAMNFATDKLPSSLAVGDLNGDGIPDVVVGTVQLPFNGTLSLLLGKGDGTFGAPAVTTTNVPVRCVAIADFNRDAKADLLVGTSFGGQMFLGNGDGTFLSPVHLTLNTTYSVAVGDFNGDGYPDIAGTIYNGNAVTILLGNGDGTFVTAGTYNTGVNPRSVFAADFTGDGKTDLAVANFGTAAGVGSSLTVLTGNGDGTFQVAATYATGLNPTTVVGEDFNGDGRMDLVVAMTGNAVEVFQGAFRPPTTVTFSVPVNPAKVGQSVTLTAAIDPPDATGSVTFVNNTRALGTNLLVNGMATLRVKFAAEGVFTLQARYLGNDSEAPAASGFVNLTVSGTLPGSMTTLRSNANPVTPGQALTLSATVLPAGVTGSVTFFDGTAVLGTSLLVNGSASFAPALLAGRHMLKAYYSGDANYAASSGTLLQSVTPVASRGFLPAANYSVGGKPLSVVAGDFNGDGKLDLAIANSADNTVVVLLGFGDGRFEPAVAYPTGNYPTAVVAGDFNGDGKLDLAVANNQDDTIAILAGNGNGTFAAAVFYATGNGPYALAVGDLNGDGIADLVVANQLSNSVGLFVGNGDGTFQGMLSFLGTSYPNSVIVADANNDGKADIIASNINAAYLDIYIGNGDGTFTGPRVLFAGTSGGFTGVAAADFNGDGLPDLAASSYVGNVAVVLSSAPTFNYLSPVPYATGAESWSIVPADVNGDGNIDLLVANEGAGNISVLRGKGDGTFLEAIDYLTGAGPVALAIGDFNGDGRPDAAVVNNGDGTVSILLAQ